MEIRHTQINTREEINPKSSHHKGKTGLFVCLFLSKQMWEENICKSHILQRDSSSLYKEHSKLNSEKTNNPVENEQKIWTDISPQSIQRWQHIKIWSTSIASREMQIKSIVHPFYTS